MHEESWRGDQQLFSECKGFDMETSKKKSVTVLERPQVKLKVEIKPWKHCKTSTGIILINNWDYTRKKSCFQWYRGKNFNTQYNIGI